MPRFGKHSLTELETLDPRLQRVLIETIKHIDYRIINGHRGQAEQNRLYLLGRSKVKYPNSKHNADPSHAFDVAPYYTGSPHIRWSDRAGFIYLAGVIMGIAASMGIKLRWGGDWDSDNDQSDERFRDFGHFEILGTI